MFIEEFCVHDDNDITEFVNFISKDYTSSLKELNLRASVSKYMEYS